MTLQRSSFAAKRACPTEPAGFARLPGLTKNGNLARIVTQVSRGILST